MKRMLPRLLAIAGAGLLASLSWAANPSGNLRIEVLSAYNFVVDSNVETPGSYAPRSAYLGAKFYNDGGHDITNLYAYIGNLADNTPGVYPSRVHAGITGPLAGGAFALTHVGGSSGLADATRYIPVIPAGGYVAVYWLVTYPQMDQFGKSVCGGSKPNDDLWLTYDIWADAYDNGAPLSADVTRRVTMRSEISAMANKIYPSGANKVPQEYKDMLEKYSPSWTNMADDGSPGTLIVNEGVWYDLGNIGGGFDNDGDLVPDNNAWLQPVGDPTLFDPSCFRLENSYVMLVVKLKGGGEEVYMVEDQLYFQNLPENIGVVGYVRYSFRTLRSGCASQMTPYQEAASGKDNEKFNGDFGASLGASMASQTTAVDFVKSADAASADPGDAITYTLAFTNAGTLALGNPAQGMPLVVQDQIPGGSTYVGGSASAGIVLPPGVDRIQVQYSTNGGASWLIQEPTPASKVTHLQWWLNSALPPGSAGSVSFEVLVNAPFTNANPQVRNIGGLSFGSGAAFMQSEARTQVLGGNSLSGSIYQDDGAGGGVLGNQIRDGGEAGITDVLVSLYYDANGNGVLDSGDYLVAETHSIAGGGYAFTNLFDGKYLVTADTADPDIPEGYGLTTRALLSADLDSAGASADPAHATGANFGFAPALAVSKTLISGASLREGASATYAITITNRFPGQVTPPASSNHLLWATNGTSASGWTAVTNAYIPPYPDGNSARCTVGGNADTLTLNQFLTATSSVAITNVELHYVAGTSGNFDGDDEVTLDVKRNGITIYNRITLLNAFSNGHYIVNLTTNAAWTWANFGSSTTMVVTLTCNKNSGGSSGKYFDIDQVGFYVTTLASAEIISITNVISTLPLYDHFDAARFQYVSATPPPSSVTTNSGVGTLYWSNLGPLYGGRSVTVTVNLKAQEPPGNAATLSTNQAAVEGAYFENGRQANASYSAAQAVHSPAGSIGHLVWRDINGNGLQDGGNETGIPGVSVVLWPPAGVDLGNGTGAPVTNRTDASGNYLFEGLPASGTYTVRVLTATLPGGSGTNTGDPDGGGDSQAAVPLTYDAPDGSDKQLHIDFGYITSSTIEGYLWNDYNRDGASLPGPGEPMLAGVTVYLCAGPAPCGAGSALATNVSDAGGFYRFTGSYNGQYVVSVATNLGTLTNGAWVASYDSDGLGTLNHAAVSVVAGGQGLALFSYTKSGPYSLGGNLFLDLNSNGVWNAATEEGLYNVTVHLYQDHNTNGIVDSNDPMISTASSATNGAFLFLNLPATNYLVVVDHSDPQMPPLYRVTRDPWGALDGRSLAPITTSNRFDQLFGYFPFGQGEISGVVWRDANADGLRSGGAETGITNVTVSLWADLNNDGVYVLLSSVQTGAGGSYSFPALPDGHYRVVVSEADPSLPLDAFGNRQVPTTGTDVPASISGSGSQAVDVGFTSLGAVGDRIFWDANHNGTFDINEDGVTGATVRLYVDANSNGIYDAGTDVLYDSASTGTNGLFLFTALPASWYVVRVEMTGPLAGVALSADPNADGVPCEDPLAVGCDGAYGLRVSPGQNFMGADFGFAPNGIIGQSLWMDINNNGLRDPEEGGLPYVTVELWSGGLLVSSKETDANGDYVFSGIPDGTYRVVVREDDPDFPAGMVQTYSPSDTLNGTVTNVVITSGAVSHIGGNACFDCGLAVNLGYRLVGNNSLSGTLGYEGLAVDGVLGSGPSGVNPGEVPIVGGTVYIYLWNDAGGGVVDASELTLLTSATSDSNGDYVFTGLPNGDGDDHYIVSFYAPPGKLELTTTNGATPATRIAETKNAQGYTVSAYQVVPISANIQNLDFAFKSLVHYDFGDLPISYSTILENAPSGARHIVPETPTLFLGATVETEINGQPSLAADGDGAEEDGLTRLGCWLEGPDGGAVSIVAGGSSSGWLVGFVDFNQDGNFGGVGERVINCAVSPGTLTNAFTIPSGTFSPTQSATLYARFRLLPTQPVIPDVMYSGSADDGEVEDYRWEFSTAGQHIWNDLNGNGVQDPGEPPLSGVRIFADLNGDGLYQAGEPFGISDENGLYGIAGLPTGAYTARVDTVSSGSQVMIPTYDLDGVGTPGAATFSVSGAQVREDLNFGYRITAIISGTVLRDENGNGIRDPEDTNGLYGAEILLYLDRNGDTIPDPGEVIATNYTSLNGTYSFLVPSNGNYLVVENDPGGFVSTGDSSGGNDNRVPTVMNNSDVSGQFFLDHQNAPTYALVTTVRSYTAEAGCLIEFETATEAGSIGFEVYRLASNRRILLNAAPIPALNDLRGGVYRLADPRAKPGLHAAYEIVELDAGGGRRPQGVFELVSGAAGTAPDNETPSPRQNTVRRISMPEEPSGHSTPAFGNLLKIPVQTEGMKYVSPSTLAEAFQLPEWRIQRMLSLGQLALTHRNDPVAYIPADKGQGLYFYGQAPDRRTVNENIYWLSAGYNPAVGRTPGGRPALQFGGRFQHQARVEQDLQAMPAQVRTPGEDFWFWRQLLAGHPSFQSASFSFQAPGLAAGESATLTLHLRGGNEDPLGPVVHQVEVSINQVVLGEAIGFGMDAFTWSQEFNPSLLRESNNQLVLKAVLADGIKTSRILVDAFEVEYPKCLKARNGALAFQAAGQESLTLEGFSTPAMMLFDITDPCAPRQVTGLTVTEAGGRFAASFQPPAPNRRYVAFEPGAAEVLAHCIPTSASTLAFMENEADYLIITADPLAQGAQELADYRAAQGMRVKLVKLSEVYDVFGSGHAEPEALARFLQHAWQAWSAAPRYAVLIGDGSYDYRSLLRHGDNLLPPLLAGTPYGLYPSDSLLGDTEGTDGAPEIAVGRLPAQSPQELAVMIAKIKAFESSARPLLDVLLLSDNPDAGGDFPADADHLQALLRADGMAFAHISLGRLELGPARTQLLALLNQGTRWVNYFGHGGMDRLAAEGLLTSADCASLTNAVPPVFLNMTCVAGQFAQPGFSSLSEALLCSPNGATAVWSPSGLSLNDIAIELNQALLAEIASGNADTLGDAILAALQKGAQTRPDHFMLKIFNLLGDPALRLYP